MPSIDPRRGLTAWFVSNPVAANILMVLIIALGVVTARGLPRESFPSIPPNRITIEVAFPSGSPQLAEEGIVLKIEEALQGTPGIKRVSSTARTDGVTVIVEKASGTDLDPLLSEVKARIDAIPNLPRRAERPVIRKQAIEEHVIWVQITGDVDERVLDATSQALRRELLRSPSIRRVDRAGHREAEIHIEADDGTLEAYGLTLADLSQAVTEESLTDLSGQLRSKHGEISLKADRQAYWRQDFADIPLVMGADGTTPSARRRRARSGHIQRFVSVVDALPGTVLNRPPGLQGSGG